MLSDVLPSLGTKGGFLGSGAAAQLCSVTGKCQPNLMASCGEFEGPTGNIILVI